MVFPNRNGEPDGTAEPGQIKKRKVRKRFGIDVRYRKSMFKFMSEWHSWGKYLTEERRDQALERLNQNHGPTQYCRRGPPMKFRKAKDISEGSEVQDHMAMGKLDDTV